MKEDFENDIENSISVLKNGGIILYPTDTIWGIGCDATNEKAVKNIFSLKKRTDGKSLIILVADKKDIYNYVEHPDKKLLDYLSFAEKPTTAIYEGAKNLAKNLLSSDGTIAVRIVKDSFCRELIHQFKKPIVSTSANVSGQPFPTTFNNISPEIKNSVEYIVQHRQNKIMVSQPSSIIKVNKEGNIEIIRS